MINIIIYMCVYECNTEARIERKKENNNIEILVFTMDVCVYTI